MYVYMYVYIYIYIYYILLNINIEKLKKENFLVTVFNLQLILPS